MTTLAPAGRIESLRAMAGDIKLAHSIFALPFAILATAIAWPGFTPWLGAAVVGLILACMVLARTWAMLVNRLLDARFDAENPRTSRRAFASGRVSIRDGWTAALACAAGFVLAAGGFLALTNNPWPLVLSVPVLAWIGFYSLTKRFTALSHLVLGVSLAASPISAALAVDPPALASRPAIAWLSGMVVLWVAGFDIIYSLQDLAFDRARGLHSIPSKLGRRGAVWVSRAFHAAAALLLVQASRSDPRLGLLFDAAVALVIVLLAAEHVVLARQGNAGLPMAFFTINGVVSVVLGIAGCVSIAWSGMA